MLRPTRGRELSRYRVMVKYLGVLLRRTRQLRVPIMFINWWPSSTSFARCMLYLYHSYLVIGMLLRLIGLKECGLVTQSLELGWPLSEFGTRVRAREDLFHISSPHKSGMPYCSVYREQYTLNIYLWIRLCITCRVVWRYVHSFSLTSDIAQVHYTKNAPQPYWRLRIVSIIWCYLFPVILKGVVVWVQIV